jgi:glycosyltransferase involved in cell wall biosynthesis
MEIRRSLLFVEPEDFTRQLYGGGGASIVAQIVRSFGDRLAIVGMTSDSHAIGQWTYAEIYGRRCLFLPVMRRADAEGTILISRNLRFAVALAQHRKALREVGIESVFSQTWAVLWFFAFWPGRWDICYYYPGLRNSILHGTHRVLGKILAGPYEIVHSLAVRRANVVLAAASRDAIVKHQRHLRRLGTNKEIKSLPTATDVELFRPRPRETVRPKLGLPLDAPVYVYVGRLAEVKGVPLILDAFKIVRESLPKALLLIVGDGEERPKLTELVQREGMAESVRFLGLRPPEQVAEFIACADAGLFASYVEGFSVAMIEQLACGCPIVTTDVSGAHDLVVDGRNGFVLPTRNAGLYARRMLDVLELPAPGQFSRALAVREFSMESLCTRLQRAWAPFAALADSTETGGN